MLSEKYKTVLLFILIHVFSVTSHWWKPVLNPGDDCLLKDGSKGFCTVLSQCPYALAEMNTQHASLEFCAFDPKRPLICCLNCTAVERDAYSYAYNYHRQNVPENCKKPYFQELPCKEFGGAFDHLDERIMCVTNGFISSPMVQAAAGGEDAKRGQFPHMALIGYGDDKDSADWMCGGSVINHRYILTAAHCISSPALGQIKYAALGLLRRTDDPSMWQIYDVEQIIPYPEYSPPSKYHDIALLRTAAWIGYNIYVYPACLHRGADMPDEGIATGWGATGHKQRVAEVLQVVKVKKYSDQQCSTMYPKHRHLKGGYNRTTQICYGDEDKINDTCEGDSGGPLQMPPPPQDTGRCMYVVFGVTSYGRSCGYAGSTGMYTRVAAYIPWIESVAGELQ